MNALRLFLRVVLVSCVVCALAIECRATAALTSDELDSAYAHQAINSQSNLNNDQAWTVLNDDQYIDSSSDAPSTLVEVSVASSDSAADTNVEGQFETQQDATADEAMVESEAEAVNTVEQEHEASAEDTEPALLDEETSMSILMELSVAMDVSSILEQELHQALFKAKAESSPKATASSASKSTRGPAASRLTKDVHTAKFARFTAAHKRKYKSPAEAATAFQTFSKNREAIVALNDRTASNRGTVFKSSGPFADKAPGTFARTRTNSRIPLNRAAGKAVRIKRRSSRSSSSNSGAGLAAGSSGNSAGKSGKTGGEAGGFARDAGGNAQESGGAAKKSGKTGGNAGGTGKKSGKTGGDSGAAGTKSGKTGGDAGATGKKSGKTGGDAGGNGKKSGKTGGNSGTDGMKSGKTGGNKGQNNALQPVLPPTEKATEEGLSNDIGVTADSIRQSMKAAGVSDDEIKAAFAQLKGEYKKGGDIGMDLFGYQKGECGSCWAHAAGDALTRLWKKQQKWTTNELISVQQVLDCVKTSVSNGCNGGSPMDAIDYWTMNPVALMKEYPLMETTSQCKAAPFGGRPNYKAAFGWEMSIPACTDKGDCKGQIAYEHLLLAWLKGNSLTPIVYLDASQFQHYSGGIFPLSACSSTTAKGNHIVQIVGYGTDSATGVPYWVIRNSWSRSWGEDGQIRIPFGVNACGVMNFVISVSDPANSDINDSDIGTSNPIFGRADLFRSDGTMDPKATQNFEGKLSKAQILGRLAVKSQEKNQFTLDEVALRKQSASDAKKFLAAKGKETFKEIAARKEALANKGINAAGTAPVPKGTFKDANKKREAEELKKLVAQVRSDNEDRKKLGLYVMTEAEIQSSAKDALASRKKNEIDAIKRAMESKRPSGFSKLPAKKIHVKLPPQRG